MSETMTKPAATPKALSMIAPNLYNLSGGGVHVTYSTTGVAGQPHLTYHDAFRNLSFSGNQIRAVNVPDLGTVVSVTILLTVDTGSTTFSVLLPLVNLSGPADSAPVSTDGITTHLAFSIIPAFNHGQREFYSVVPMTGTASPFIF